MMNNYCLNCDEQITAAGTGRKPKFCSAACRVSHHRRLKRYKNELSNCNETSSLTGVLILELFPGAGLFGKAFEKLGATVVRGPDILWGGDVKEFNSFAGKFDGIIGDPPCQFASTAAIHGTSAINLIPEFVRVVEQSKPKWAIMENVREAKPYAPQWNYVSLKDWNCGGNTHRKRGFWFYGMEAPPAPDERPGVPAYSVLASNWNNRGSNRISGHLHLTPQQAATLQGYPELADRIREHQPGWRKKKGGFIGVSDYSRDVLATHMLGNGVPAAMGNYIAAHVAYIAATRGHHARA